MRGDRLEEALRERDERRLIGRRRRKEEEGVAVAVAAAEEEKGLVVGLVAEREEIDIVRIVGERRVYFWFSYPHPTREDRVAGYSAIQCNAPRCLDVILCLSVHCSGPDMKYVIITEISH
ncbi:hypothetical protein Salat_2851000 [Sesamum alatum]|uniref:Uncharacterized protein n=1 Tax=Sesamum alatum TaxID=300844 RepID=A0AAE2CA51_9LAMI|nr:hypothetical protein Salat_2851000 [Sesamum alatum]